eukprot:TRINITY_DN637_c0_g1_i1.p1 TRINITY_DN637_c0_g1~~TRINITY_DN637_c0_g1_i1.p1  ORF type:complete len:113 (+),score=22.00 TRINITY_DN637_c0_g1_i1:152-490(+)
MKFLALFVIFAFFATVFAADCSGSDRDHCNNLLSTCNKEQQNNADGTSACICASIYTKCVHKAGCLSDADYNSYVDICKAGSKCTEKQCNSASAASFSAVVLVATVLFAMLA